MLQYVPCKHMANPDILPIRDEMQTKQLLINAVIMTLFEINFWYVLKQTTAHVYVHLVRSSDCFSRSGDLKDLLNRPEELAHVQYHRL